MRGDPDRELVVFTEALEVPVPERATFLKRVCAGDENLRILCQRNIPIRKQVRAQARAFGHLEEARGDDLIGIDVRAR